jgi:hypothetical protein
MARPLATGAAPTMSLPVRGLCSAPRQRTRNGRQLQPERSVRTPRQSRGLYRRGPLKGLAATSEGTELFRCAWPRPNADLHRPSRTRLAATWPHGEKQNSRKCQTTTATPAQPWELLTCARRRAARRKMRSPLLRAGREPTSLGHSVGRARPFMDVAACSGAT